MDPIGVENDPNKWGVITRLLHLDKVIDGNSPFELFKKTEISAFQARNRRCRYIGGNAGRNRCFDCS